MKTEEIAEKARKYQDSKIWMESDPKFWVRDVFTAGYRACLFDGKDLSESKQIFSVEEEAKIYAMTFPRVRRNDIYKGYLKGYSVGYQYILSKKEAEWKEKTEDLINALQQLMDGVAGLPPLSAIAGVLEKQYKQAEEAIKNVKS